MATKNNTIKPRLLFFFIGIVGFFGLVMFRLVDLQVIQGKTYADLADDNRFFSMPIPAERGVLLDRYQDSLVNNTRSYYALAQGSELFSQRLPISREEALQKMASDSASFVTSESVGYDMVRQYKYPKSLAHILGYVGLVTAEELKENSQLGIADSIGKMGLEKNFDTQLQGQEGRDIYEIDALGNKQQIRQRQDALSGNNVQTSLDPYLSEVALNALGDNQGSVVIADAATGEILALVNSPGFDANVFSKVTSDPSTEKTRKQMLQTFLSDQRQVFFNKAVGGSYPPGSVFKLVTALAGLESGDIDTNTAVLDEGTLKVGEYEYANWYYTQYGRTEGSIGLIRSIARSNDIFFYKAAEFTGPTTIANTARLLGLGEPTEVEVQSEASGLVPDPEWKEKVKGERWYLGNTYHYGIGQGDILVSPIQVAQMVQAIANNGKMCRPTLLRKNSTGAENIVGGLGSDCSELGIQQENIDIVLEGMLDACSSGGTGYPFFKHNEWYRTKVVLEDDSADTEDSEIFVSANPEDEILNGAIACKTGTAEFGGADAQGYRNTHGWFVGILGVDEERFADEATNETVDVDSDPEGVTASESAQNETTEQEEPDSEANFGREEWVEKVKTHGFPDKIVMVALVESDEDNPFKEGSRDAGPVVEDIVNWMFGE